MLVTSNFSFSHSVFKRLVLQTRKNQGLFGKGLNPSSLDHTVSESFGAGVTDNSNDDDLSNLPATHSYPITRRQILDSSKLKEFADDNFEFDENGRKFSKRVENTVGKGEIARYEQFLLFPGALKGVIVWECDKVK